MPRNLAVRYEHFLRLHALIDILANARQPLDDATLIGDVRERLGLTRLSPRTLHRDCDFLIGCGYPLDRITLQAPRRNGWSLDREAVTRIFPAASTLTILELVSFGVARDLLRAFEGTVLWAGIESLRTKLEAAVSDELRDRLGLTRSMFRVETDPSTRLADHPRMLSALATAIVEHRLIDVEHRGDAGMVRSRLEPSWLRIKPPTIELVARARLPDGEIRETSIGVAEITRVTLLDETFAPRPSDPGPASPAG